VMSSASSAVIYTFVYTDSEPGRVFWGADEEISDGGSLRVIVYGYDGLPMQPVAPPSSDYIPDSEEPQIPLVPQDEDEREPMYKGLKTKQKRGRGFEMQEGYIPSTPRQLTRGGPRPDPIQTRARPNHDSPVDWRSTVVDRWLTDGPVAGLPMVRRGLPAVTVDWYEVSRSTRGSISLVDPAGDSLEAITPDLPIEEPDNSLSMGDEHLSTIPETESDELIKSSVEILVPIPSLEEVNDDHEEKEFDLEDILQIQDVILRRNCCT
ncbi:hypothetical protein Tco_0389055, partial [Tanacetum coccineum]